MPTKYYRTPTAVFREAGFSVVIWANHLMRSALAAMQATAREIFQGRGVQGIEAKIATIEEVFRLQGERELVDAERRYLPAKAKR